jgi:hypothetical protein
MEPCAVLLKNKIKSVTPNKFVWHVSYRKHRESILKHGLIPQESSKSEDWGNNKHIKYPKVIYVNNHNDFTWWFPFMESCYCELDTTKYDVWKIDTEMVCKKGWYTDYNLTSDADFLFTFNRIPPEALSLHVITPENFLGEYEHMVYGLPMDAYVSEIDKTTYEFVNSPEERFLVTPLYYHYPEEEAKDHIPLKKYNRIMKKHLQAVLV